MSGHPLLHLTPLLTLVHQADLPVVDVLTARVCVISAVLNVLVVSLLNVYNELLAGIACLSSFVSPVAVIGTGSLPICGD